MPLPTLSIVTVSYNQARFLGEALRSVLSQRGDAHEFFVIDGGSTDGSADIIRQHAEAGGIDWWVSEKDRGQTDAIAKGFARATGDYLAWINSDDLYLPGALRRARAALAADPGADLLGGWHVRIDEGSRVLSAHRLPAESAAAARWGVFHPNQPTVFFRRSLYEKVGGISLDLHLVLDTELWFRMMDAGGRWGHVPAYQAAFRVHGGSKSFGRPQTWAHEYADLTRRYPHYHAPTAKHYLGRAVAKAWRTLAPDALAARRDTRRWRGKPVAEALSAEFCVLSPAC